MNKIDLLKELKSLKEIHSKNALEYCDAEYHVKKNIDRMNYQMYIEKPYLFDHIEEMIQYYKKRREIIRDLMLDICEKINKIENKLKELEKGENNNE
jgi:hypothetical protein